jgi:hypothetical protein
MKIALVLLNLCVVAFFSSSALATPHPSTLAIHCTGSAPATCASQGLLTKSSIETYSTGGGQSDQFLVLASGDAHCVISKSSAAKQGVTIEFLNEMAQRYQVEVTCTYIYPLQQGQVSDNGFSYRASIR